MNDMKDNYINKFENKHYLFGDMFDFEKGILIPEVIPCLKEYLTFDFLNSLME